MIGYISTAEFNSKIAASLVFSIINDDICSKLGQFSDLCQEIINVDDFQQWVGEEENYTQVLAFLRNLYSNKDSLWFSFFYSEIEYDLIVYILHAAIIKIDNVSFELKPKNVDLAYQYCQKEHLIELLKEPTLELVNRICDCILKSFNEEEFIILTPIMQDENWRIGVLNLFREKFCSYMPFLMSHTIYVLKNRNAASRLIDQVEAKQSILNEIRDAMRLTHLDLALLNNSQDQTQLVICEALCKVFSHSILELAENKATISNDYVMKVFYYMFAIVGLERIQWFVSESFYSEIGKTLEQLINGQ